MSGCEKAYSSKELEASISWSDKKVLARCENK